MRTLRIKNSFEHISAHYSMSEYISRVSDQIVRIKVPTSTKRHSRTVEKKRTVVSFVGCSEEFCEKPWRIFRHYIRACSESYSCANACIGEAFEKGHFGDWPDVWPTGSKGRYREIEQVLV